MLPALEAAARRAARRPAPLPHGRRRPAGHGRGGRPRRRHVRLRAADPARPPRHGAHLRRAPQPAQRARYADDAGPLDPACGCAVCARWSRAYLRHLLPVAEPTAPRLLTLHNVAWTFALVARIRAAIRGRARSAALRAEVAGRPGARPCDRRPGVAPRGTVPATAPARLDPGVAYGAADRPRRHLRPAVGPVHPAPSSGGSGPTSALVAVGSSAGDEVVLPAGIYGRIVDLDADDMPRRGRRRASSSAWPGRRCSAGSRTTDAGRRRADDATPTDRRRRPTPPSDPDRRRPEPLSRCDARSWSAPHVHRGARLRRPARRPSIAGNSPELGLDLQGGASVVLRPDERGRRRAARPGDRDHPQPGRRPRRGRARHHPPGRRHRRAAPRREEPRPGPRARRPDRRAAVPARCSQSADPATRPPERPGRRPTTHHGPGVDHDHRHRRPRRRAPTHHRPRRRRRPPPPDRRDGAVRRRPPAPASRSRASSAARPPSARRHDRRHRPPRRRPPRPPRRRPTTAADGGEPSPSTSRPARRTWPTSR